MSHAVQVGERLSLERIGGESSKIQTCLSDQKSKLESNVWLFQCLRRQCDVSLRRTA